MMILGKHLVELPMFCFPYCENSGGHPGGKLAPHVGAGICLYEFYFSPGGLSAWLPFVSATTQDKSKVGNLISD